MTKTASAIRIVFGDRPCFIESAFIAVPRFKAPRDCGTVHRKMETSACFKRNVNYNHSVRRNRSITFSLLGIYFPPMGKNLRTGADFFPR